MNYFTSDLHLGHKSVIEFCNRPFKDVDEMDAALIANWNKRVKKSDTVYILGDLMWETAEADKYLPLLNGKKILITGNHDIKWLRRYSAQDYFEEVTPYLETNVDGVTLTLCHYPMVEWKASRKLGSKKLGFHIHGHIHNACKELYRCLYLAPHALNAGVDITDYAPATFEELKAFNGAFKAEMLKLLP